MKRIGLIVSALVLTGLVIFTTSSLTDAEVNFNPYKNGDTISFKSSNGKVESLIIGQIEQKHLGYHPVPMFDPSYGIWNPEKLTVFYHHPNTYYMSDSLSEREFIEITKYKRTEGAEITIHLFTFWTSVLVDKLDFTDTLTISNNIYNDISILKESDPDPIPQDYDWNNINPTELYWSKSEGLVKFREQNGTVWTRVE